MANLIDDPIVAGEIDGLRISAAEVARELQTVAPLGTPEPFVFDSLNDHPRNEIASIDRGTRHGADLDTRIELGCVELPIEDVSRLKEGSVVPLDKLAGDPVDILIGGRLIARGEVLVLNGNFCVRVAEILAPNLATF